METMHALIVYALLLLLAVTTNFNMPITITMALPTTAKPNRLIAKLIHHDSIYSPFYDHTETNYDRAMHAIKRSVARLALLSKRVLGVQETRDIRSDIFLNSGVFFLNFSVGQPPVPQLTVMDSGSDMLWVKCLPCTMCWHESIPIFDPSKSSTYFKPSCRKSECSYRDCNDECAYNIKYVRGPGSSGFLVFEQLTFDNPDGEKIAVPEIILGCAREIDNFHDVQLNGVFGLGVHGPFSLISQIGSKFSYCIGNMTDPHYSYNQLILGNAAIMDGSFTPFETVDGHYYITLEGISVGGEMLGIDPSVFTKTPRTDNGVIIDSGTSITWLAKVAYDVLRDKVRSIIKMVLTEYRLEGMTDQLCYSGTLSEDLQSFPVVAFHFAEGADLVLDTGSVFRQVQAKVFCMAIGPSYVNGQDSTNLSIIGMMAQQNYNVGYDLDNRKIHLQRIDCELLAD